jgi:hypothetical protein
MIKNKIIALVVVLCANFLFCANTFAQGLKIDESAPIKNLKVISEESDGKGHIVRTVQYSRGNIRVTETIFMTQAPVIGGLNYPVRPDTLQKNLLEIVVSKSQYRLALS